MSAPFLEVVTRHMPHRAALLAQHDASLLCQTDGDWVQTLLVDEERRGIEYANAQLGRHVPVGRWMWVLDDDDVCIHNTLFEELKVIVAQNDIDVVIVRGDCSTHGVGVIPPNELWGQQPHHGAIGMSNFIVAAKVWSDFAWAWPAARAADYSFISSVHEQLGPDRFFWHNVIAMRTLQCGNLSGK